MPLVEEMLRIEAYFKRLKEEGHHSFEQLYLATKEINELIGGSLVLSRAELEMILRIFNDTTEQTQANGTGWYDVRLHLTGLIRANGMASTVQGQFLRLL